MNFWIVLVSVFGFAACQNRYRPEAVSGRAVAILKQNNDINPDGSYQWSFEADNGISAQEQGRSGNSKDGAVEAQGGFQYTAPDDTPIQLTYVADENGFQPQGAHLPVAPAPPPIPDYILRSIAYNAAHPEQDDERPQRPRF